MTRKISKEQEKREQEEIRKGRKKVKFIGHVVRADPNIDKEDTRPIEKKRKKPDFSMDWEKMQEAMNNG